MRSLIFLILIAAGAYYGATQFGLIETEESQAVITYKQFMDKHIIRNYDAALAYTTGEAMSQVESKQSGTSMQFAGRTIDTPSAEKGIVEGSRIAVIDQQEEGDTIYLTITYSASISWPGMTANKMSPGSWRNWEQTAQMTNASGEWKVASFDVGQASK